MQSRHFGLEEANRLVPHLTRTFETVRGLVSRSRTLQSKVVLLPKGSEQRAGIEAERDSLVLRVKEELAKLDEIGVEIKDVEGLVDFRALMDGRTVFLCWRYPEARVDHWHELDAGYSGRRLIDDGFKFEKSFLS